MRTLFVRVTALAAIAVTFGTPLAGQIATPQDSVIIRFESTDLASAVRLIGQYLDRPVIFAGSSGAQVTLDTPRPVARRDILRLLSGIVDAHGFEVVDDSASGLYRVRPKEPPRPPPSMAASPALQRRAGGDPELFVVNLKHARAADVAHTVNSLYGRGQSSSPESAQPVTTLSDDLRGNLVPPAGARTGETPSISGGRPATLSGEITIVPDSRANLLLVRANRADFDLVRALVEQIDVRPLQVLIEVLIAEVRRDRSLGVSVDGEAGPTPIGNGNTTAEGTLGSPGLGDFALRVMGLGGADAEVGLTLAAQRGEVRILSRPILLATNNEQSSIIVGSQRPFVQVSRALPTDAASRDQVVQYKEVGTKLTVRPSISEDGAVQLDVTQEVSSATTETAFNAPVISTRSVQTQLLVRDGQTVALGGLRDEQRDATSRGLPLLSAIPLIGGFFGSSERRRTETELFVFITPRVIRTDADAMRLSRPLQERAVPSEAVTNDTTVVSRTPH